MRTSIARSAYGTVSQHNSPMEYGYPGAGRCIWLTNLSTFPFYLDKYTGGVGSSS